MTDIEKILQFLSDVWDCPLNYGFVEKKYSKALDEFYSEDEKESFCEQHCEYCSNNQDYKICWKKFFDNIKEDNTNGDK